VIEHPLTAALADLRAAEYETPTTVNERRVIAWTLHMVGSDPDIAEAFDRERFAGGAA
jgi:hypothetical protein